MIYCERSFPNLLFDGDFLRATKSAFLQPQQKSCGRQLSSEVPSSIATFKATIKQPTKARTAFLRGLVGRILVRRPPDLPDLLLRPCGIHHHPVQCSSKTVNIYCIRTNAMHELYWSDTLIIYVLPFSVAYTPLPLAFYNTFV